jgi:hypothetical protein
MHMRLTFLICGFLFAASVTPAAAQRRTRATTRTPAADMWAVGGSLGATIPTDSSLDKGLEVVGNAEFYLTPRVSIRGQLGAGKWDVIGRGFTGTVKPLYVDGNVVYNWEGGALHPYVTGGVGVYRFGSSFGLLPDFSDTHPGIDGGGGVEYFFTRRAAMTFELLYHKVDAFTAPLTAFGAGSFWSFAVGGKAYF